MDLRLQHRREAVPSVVQVQTLQLQQPPRRRRRQCLPRLYSVLLFTFTIPSSVKLRITNLYILIPNISDPLVDSFLADYDWLFVDGIYIAEQNNKRIVLALQSGLKSEVTWALNTLTLLSFKERDEIRRDVTPLAKIPGLLDALLLIIDDWRDIALPKDLTRGTRVRSLGVNSSVTGFGSEYDALASIQTPGSSGGEALGKKSKHESSQWWNEEDGLFNLDDEGRAEKQLCAIAASNVIRNFSFMPDNEVVMAQHRHCLETVYQCINDHMTGKESSILCYRFLFLGFIAFFFIF